MKRETGRETIKKLEFEIELAEQLIRVSINNIVENKIKIKELKNGNVDVD